MDTAEIGKRTRQENRRLTWLAVKQNKASYLMIAPFMLFFLVFTIVPVLMSLPMGFTDFNMVQMPKFIGLSNYTTLFLADKVFIQSIRVTLVFALFTGPISYVLCFLLAWLINELHPKLRTIFTLIFYAPSMANVYTVWKLIFSGDSYGYQNFSKVARLVDECGSAVILKNNVPRYLVIDFSKAEQETTASDEDVLSISKRLMEQNKEAYEVLAK